MQPINDYPKIDFSNNWNSKLICHAFTTVRLRNDNRYFPGLVAEIRLLIRNKEPISFGLARIRQVTHFRLETIPSLIAWVDTGYSLPEFKKIITTMYKNKDIDWNTQQISAIVLEKIKPEKSSSLSD